MKRPLLCPLSTAADALLAQVPRDKCAPHYSETTFHRKLQTASRRESRLSPAFGRDMVAYLVRKEWEEIVDRAELTPRQWEVMSQRLEGHTFEEIGRRSGCSRQGALNVYLQGAKKLARAWRDYPYRGLPQSFEDDLRRGRTRRS